MKRLFSIVVLLLGAGIIGIIAAPRLDPVCLAQMGWYRLQHERPGWNCLSYAAARGDRRIMRRMLNAGMPVDERTAAGATPLMLAAQHGRLQSVKLLLAHGAVINAQDAYGASALAAAAHHNHAAVVRHLVHAGATVDLRDRIGRTPLRLAAGQAGHGNAEVAHILIHARADATAADYRGDTPLMAAARVGHVTMLAYLLQLGVPLVAHNDRGDSALLLAVQHDQLEAVRLLLEHAATGNHADKQKALQFALARGHARMAALLRTHGATINPPPAAAVAQERK